jgi:hypothetical protein
MNTMLDRGVYDYKIVVIYAIYDWLWLHDYLIQKNTL